MALGRRTRRQLSRLAVLLVVAAVAAVWRAAAPGTDATSPTGGDTPTSSGWTATHVVDGDTVDVTRDGLTERVRLLGIDTPERGECGYAEARDAMAALVDGRTVALVVGSSDDRDRYGRLLRYVEVVDATGATVDVGLEILTQGLAAEVYDSRTDYPRHAREDAYIAADEVTPDVCPDMREH